MSRLPRVSSRARGAALVTAGLLVAAPLLSACGSGTQALTSQVVTGINGQNLDVGDLQLRNAYVAAAPSDSTSLAPAATPTGNPTASGPTAVFYVHIFNIGSTPDTLTGADSNGAASINLDGSPEIPANGDVVFSERAPTLTLTGLTGPLRPGTAITVTLHFEHAGDVVVHAPVEELAGSPAPTSG